MAAATTNWPDDAGSATAVIESLSGAVTDVDVGATAFPWRQQAACIQWYTEPSAQAVGAANDWLSSAHTAVGAYSAGGYVNYLETDTPASRYFGENTDRLGVVRQKYDPSGLMYSAV